MFTCSNTKTKFFGIQNINRILMCRETRSVTADEILPIARRHGSRTLFIGTNKTATQKVIFRGNGPAEDRTGVGLDIIACDRKLAQTLESLLNNCLTF